MVAAEGELFDDICKEAEKPKSAEAYTWSQVWENIIWKHVFYLGLMHVALVATFIIYGFGLYSSPVKKLTIAWIFVVGHGTSVGITAGAHRLWSHRTYKAKLPLRILLATLYTVMGLYDLYNWIRDHRVHHKYSETVADPHNAKRGFFFSHVGWVMAKRNPECIRRGREIDMKDIRADAVVMFQRKYATLLKVIFCYAIPTAIPIIFWEETLLHAVLTQCIIRHVVFLHYVWSVNSIAHLWGSRPYNKYINPAENRIVSLITLGEGSHNYHHTFPWDYKASELPYLNFNSTTLFIDAMAKLGWAYDLREPSPELVKKVTQRIGYKSENRSVY